MSGESSLLMCLGIKFHLPITGHQIHFGEVLGTTKGSKLLEINDKGMNPSLLLGIISERGHSKIMWIRLAY